MTLGMGNRDPRRETVSPAIEPTATIYFANMQPCMANISISGASASISLYGTISVRITETCWGEINTFVGLLKNLALQTYCDQRSEHHRAGKRLMSHVSLSAYVCVCVCLCILFYFIYFLSLSLACETLQGHLSLLRYNRAGLREHHRDRRMMKTDLLQKGRQRWATPRYVALHVLLLRFGSAFIT